MKLLVGKFCTPCKMLKTWLKDQGIDVEEIFAEDNYDLIEELKITQTPTLILDDNTIIVGKDAIQEYFEEKEGLNDE